MPVFAYLRAFVNCFGFARLYQLSLHNFLQPCLLNDGVLIRLPSEQTRASLLRQYYPITFSKWGSLCWSTADPCRQMGLLVGASKASPLSSSS